jgi:hypothetical protein
MGTLDKAETDYAITDSVSIVKMRFGGLGQLTSAAIKEKSGAL